MDTIPIEKQVLDYFQSLYNWGRWGKGDQLGMLNSLNEEKRKEAVSFIEEGVTVSCALVQARFLLKKPWILRHLQFTIRWKVERYGIPWLH